MKKKYFNKIDGIRGMAVILVLFYHSGIKIFNGGYIGVDIFFLISGFIITFTILQDKENKKFSLLKFFEKRFRRILPVLLITILVSLLAGLFILPYEELTSLADSSLYNLFFLSNYYYSEFKSEYFSTSSFFLPLIHTWSISIEMQFYFVCFLIFYLLKYKKSHLFIMISLSLISILICQFSGNLKFEYPYFENEFLLFNQANIGSFFQPFGRFWEFSLGSILGILIFNNKLRFVKNFYFEIIGILILFSSFILFNNIKGIPNISLIIPLIATKLLILVSLNNDKNFSILNNLVLRFFGKLSYSIFIIHQPLYVYLRYLIPANSSYLILPITIILTIFFSTVSWSLIEKPFRDSKKIKTSFFYIIILLLSFLIIIISYIFKKQIILLDNYKNIEKYYDNVIFSQNEHKIERENYFRIYRNKSYDNLQFRKKNILIIGDSLAEGLFIALNENAERYKNASFHHLDFNTNFNHFSKNLNFNDPQYNFLNNNNLFKSSEYVLITKRFSSNDVKYLPFLLDFLKAKNKKIIITDYRRYFFGYFEDPLFYILKNQRYIDKKIYERKKIDGILFNLLEDPPSYINHKIESIAKRYNAKFIKYSDINCDNKYRRCFSMTPDGNNIYFAQNHYTLRGARFIGKIIFQKKWIPFNID